MTVVRRGVSRERDPRDAVRDLATQLTTPQTKSAVFFCSATYDLERLAAELSRRFEGIDLIGCSTAGEIAPDDGYADGSLVGLSFDDNDYVTVSGYVDRLNVSSLARVRDMVAALLVRLQMRAPGADASNTLAVLLIDGMAGVEESIVSAIHRELGDVPLVGGSAGDNLRFRETVVYHGGEFRAGSAVLMLVHTWLPFEVFKTQHIVSTERKMVITEADPVRRVVTEINAEPAHEEYARQFGISGQPLHAMALATHPTVVRVGGDDYVRSIQKVNEDGSLTFYCAIDEGIVLSSGAGTNMVTDLDRLFARIREKVGVPDAILGFDCIFRRLELHDRRLENAVSGMLAANNVVGFSTYGEQFQAMHLNQTFSGVAFGRAGKRP